MGKRCDNDENETSPRFWTHAALARARVASTFSAHNPLRIQTHTHLTKSHEIPTQVVTLSNNTTNCLVFQGSHENARWSAWGQS